MRLSHLALGCLSASLLAGSAMAQPMLMAAMSCDNQFTAYISQDANTQGTAFLSGTSWGVVSTGMAMLDGGAGTYYIHVVGQDFGLPAALLGSFTLDTTDAVFANGTQALTTNITDWQCNTTGWGTPFNTPSDLGVNGVGPWGFHIGIDSNAHWIWDASNAGTVYFTTSIRVIPAPGAGLAMIGGLMFAGRRRR